MDSLTWVHPDIVAEVLPLTPTLLADLRAIRASREKEAPTTKIAPITSRLKDFVNRLSPKQPGPAASPSA